MCLRYSPTIVACVCIHLACKWSNYKIPLSAQGKEWFSYIDSSATHDLLEQLTDEFLAIFEKCPSRLKKKIMASTQAVSIYKITLTLKMLILIQNTFCTKESFFNTFQTKEEEDRRSRKNISDNHFSLDSLATASPAAPSSKTVPPGGSSSGKHHHHHHHHHHNNSSRGSSATSTSGQVVINSQQQPQQHQPHFSSSSVSKHASNPMMMDLSMRSSSSQHRQHGKNFKNELINGLNKKLLFHF
jgi:cyclin T